MGLNENHRLKITTQGDSVNFTIGYDLNLSFTLGLTAQQALQAAEELRHCAQKIIDTAMSRQQQLSTAAAPCHRPHQQSPASSPTPGSVPTPMTSSALPYEPPLNKRPRPAEANTLLPDSDDELTAQHLWFLPTARSFMASLDATEQMVADTIREPEQVWIDATGTKAVFLRGRLGVVTGLDNYQVLSVMPRTRALSSKPLNPTLPTGPKLKGRKHDGAYPKSISELVALLGNDPSVSIRRLSNNHWRAGNQHGMAVFPSTPSDHRSLLNAIKRCEKELQIDLRS